MSWLYFKLVQQDPVLINSLRPSQNGRHFADDIFNSIFLNENVWTPIKISLKFVPKGLINNIPALVQIMAWRRPGDKPLSEPVAVNLPTHICVTRPQWVKHHFWPYFAFSGEQWHFKGAFGGKFELIWTGSYCVIEMLLFIFIDICYF